MPGIPSIVENSPTSLRQSLRRYGGCLCVGVGAVWMDLLTLMAVMAAVGDVASGRYSNAMASPSPMQTGSGAGAVALYLTWLHLLLFLLQACGGLRWTLRLLAVHDFGGPPLHFPLVVSSDRLLVCTGSGVAG